MEAQAGAINEGPQFGLIVSPGQDSGCLEVLNECLRVMVPAWVIAALGRVVDTPGPWGLEGCIELEGFRR